MSYETLKEYKCYYIRSIMGSSTYGFEEVSFNGWQQNSFESEEEAIKALIDSEIDYTSIAIIRQITLTQ